MLYGVAPEAQFTQAMQYCRSGRIKHQLSPVSAPMELTQPSTPLRKFWPIRRFFSERYRGMRADVNGFDELASYREALLRGRVVACSGHCLVSFQAPS